MNIFWTLCDGSRFFGKWYVVVDIFWLALDDVGGGRHTLAGGGWWWMVVDIFWLVVGLYKCCESQVVRV